MRGWCVKVHCATSATLPDTQQYSKERDKMATSTTETTGSETKFRGYAHPEALVSTQWVADHLDDPLVRIVESDEDVLLYDQGHVPGAVKLDWITDLNDPVERDYLDRDHFEQLASQRGISNDTTLVFYGDKNNWWATYALWV